MYFKKTLCLSQHVGNGANWTHRQVWEGSTILTALETTGTLFPTSPGLFLLKVMESPWPNCLQKNIFFHLVGDVARSSSALSICHSSQGTFQTIWKKRSQHHSDKLSPATMPIKMIFLTTHFSEPDICPKSQVIHTILPLTWVILQTSFCYS